MIQVLPMEIQFHEQLIPFIRTDFPQLSLNSYIVDFFRHGQKRALQRYNFLSENETYRNLEGFGLVLSSITTSFALFSCREEDHSKIEELCKLYLQKADRNEQKQKMKEAKIQELLTFVQDPVAKVLLETSMEWKTIFRKSFRY